MENDENDSEQRLQSFSLYITKDIWMYIYIAITNY